jgi:hypothetical protein
LRPEMRASLETGALLSHFSMVHCRGMFAVIVGQVCDERTRKM